MVKSVPLFTRGEVVSYALVDDEDFERLSEVTWHPYRRGNTSYASYQKGRRKILMHREIMGVQCDGFEVEEVAPAQVQIEIVKVPKVINWTSIEPHEEAILTCVDVTLLIDALQWFMHQHEDYAKRLKSIDLDDNSDDKQDDTEPDVYRCVLWFRPEGS